MKSKITIILFGIAAILFALCSSAVLVGDRTAPEVTAPVKDITYTEGDDYAVLLDGVSAYDPEDGDISDKVRIYDIAVMDQGGKALVTYAVYDEAYNLGKATKVVNYIDVPKATTTEELTEEETTEATTEAVIPPGYEDVELTSDGAPVIALTTHYVTIKVFDDFDPMTYVADVVDDTDTWAYVYDNIEVTGDYNVYVTGEYELSYQTTDYDGNKSNIAKLMLTVEE